MPTPIASHMGRPLAARLVFALWIAGVIGLGGLLPCASHAQMRDVMVRFLPPPDEVDGYRIFVFDQLAGIEDVIEPGFIPPDPDGIARTYVALDATRSYVLEMTAYNAMGESVRSNAIAVAAEGCDPTLCDDFDPCTVDSCDPAGCLYDVAMDGTTCDDGFVDTVNDVCIAGTCTGESLVCSADADCSDGDVCNGSETCDGGLQCLAGLPLDCGVATQCTIPRCDPVLGCLSEMAMDGTTCDDGLANTSGDVCVNGVCMGTEPALEEVTLWVDQVSPDRVPQGRSSLTVTGGGFIAKPKVFFEGGEGRKPRIRSVQVLEETTLVVGIKARTRGLKGPATWDLRIRMPDRREVILPGALTVVP